MGIIICGKVFGGIFIFSCLFKIKMKVLFLHRTYKLEKVKSPAKTLIAQQRVILGVKKLISFCMKPILKIGGWIAFFGTIFFQTLFPNIISNLKVYFKHWHYRHLISFFILIPLIKCFVCLFVCLSVCSLNLVRSKLLFEV